MQFRIEHLFSLVLWMAVAFAGLALGGIGPAILLSGFLGAAMLVGDLTVRSWTALELHQRNLALFAVATCLLGLLFMLMSLIESSAT